MLKRSILLSRRTTNGLADLLTEGDRRLLLTGGGYELCRCNFGLVRGICYAGCRIFLLMNRRIKLKLKLYLHIDRLNYLQRYQIPEETVVNFPNRVSLCNCGLEI